MEPPAKRFKGGQRQRLMAAARATAAPTLLAQSALATYLIGRFAWGEMSDQTVQTIASLAKIDMEKIGSTAGKTTFPDLNSLATAGSSGSQPQNLHRDFMRRLSDKSLLQQPFFAKLKFKAPWNENLQAFLLPHETFATIYKHYPLVWKQIICPGTDMLLKFWSSVQDHPQMLAHPIKSRESYETKGIPLSFHGDGVPVTGRGKLWCKMMTMFSFSSMLGRGSTKVCQLWIWGVFDRLCCQGACDGTMDTFFQILSWSLFHLWLGIWPTTPWNSSEPFFLCTCVEVFAYSFLFLFR